MTSTDDGGTDRTPDARRHSGSSPRKVELPYGPDDKLPWIFRGPRRETEVFAPSEREPDRLAALSARRTALLTLPAVAVAWVVLTLVLDGSVLRISTITAMAISVVVGARAAVTTQRFRRRWLEEDAVPPPHVVVTLATVASVVVAFVAGLNVVADVDAGRSPLLALLWCVVGLGVVAWGSYEHLAGGRAVTAALRVPGDSPGRAPAGPGSIT